MIVKKKIVALVLIMAMCITSFISVGFETRAEDAGEDIDFSFLLTDSALIGYGELQTRGVYLADFCSIINKISSTKIGAGGITNAAVKCKVSVTSIVERKNSDGDWERVTSWTQTNASALTAGVSKSLTVGTGYYYRVRSLHYAGTDGSSSYTNALWMGN